MHCCASDVRKSQIPGRSTVMAELERNSYIASWSLHHNLIKNPDVQEDGNDFFSKNSD